MCFLYATDMTTKKTVYAASDVGGTFTDLVYFRLNGETGVLEGIEAAKAHTTPPSFEIGVYETIDKSGIKPRELAFFVHGSTVVINAITERKGATTGLLTTRGFRDILEIARGDRPDFFNLRYSKPKPFVPRYLRREVTERLDHQGAVRVPLDLSDLDETIALFQQAGVEAIAICLLHAYANPVHELALADEVRHRWPEVAVVTSHQLTREWREYERTNTAVLSAYVQPVARAYLQRLEDKFARDGFNGSMYIMQSNGGIDTLNAVKAKPITMIESGPASGMLGAAMLGRLIEEPNIIALDVGGTTAKCSLIDDGTIQVTNKYMIEHSPLSSGYPIMTPVVDIVEIGNGGGSIAWADLDGKMHVGPKNAGALPGPVAYGKGGIEPTTTDANLMLGRIDPNYFVGGEIVADMTAVAAAFKNLGDKLGLGIMDVARGVVRIANNNMVNALKLVSINRGFDTRDFTLVAFGGGGALHAGNLAVELGIPRVLIPAHSAVFSAWGMLMSDLRRDYILTRLMNFESANLLEVDGVFKDMEANALAAFSADDIDRQRIRFERRANMRYEGQEHSVQVLLPEFLSPDQIEELTEKFHTTYEREYTYRLPNAVQLVGFHLTAYGVVDRPEPIEIPLMSGPVKQAVKGEREVDFDDFGSARARIFDRRLLGADAELVGPAIIEEADSTTVVFPEQRVHVDKYGNLNLII